MIRKWSIRLGMVLKWGGICLVMLLWGCTSEEHDPVIDTFLNKTMPEQHIMILKYPLDRQVELYVEALRRRHPRDLGLASIVAKHGEKIVPVLVRRLTEHQQDGEIDKAELIEVFARMQRLGTYDVVSDEKLMVLLEQQVEDMEMPFWKDYSRKIIKRIREGGLEFKE